MMLSKMLSIWKKYLSNFVIREDLFLKKEILTKEELKQVQKLELEALVELDTLCRKHGIKYALSGGTLLGAIRHNGFIPWDDDVDVNMMRSDFNKFREICKVELGSKYFYQSYDTDPEYQYLFDKIRIKNTIFKETYLSNHHINHGIYIDIFPVDKIPDSRILGKVMYAHFRLYRIGLMGKYLNINARNGIKKLLAYVVRFFYLPFSTQFLRKKAEKCIVKFDDNRNYKKVQCFVGPDATKEVFNLSVFNDLEQHEFEGYKLLIPREYDEVLRSKYGNYMKLPKKEDRKTRHDLDDFNLSKYVGD